MTPSREKNKEHDILTAEQKRKCEELSGSMLPHAREVAEKFIDGKISLDVFDELDEVLRDPNKMEKDSYRNFMKCLAKGKFPDRGKNSLKFLHYLDAGGKTKDRAEEIVKKLGTDESSQLTARKEKSLLKELTDLHLEEIHEQETHGAAAKNQTFDIKNAVNQITETAETAETKTPSWHPDKPPEEIVRKLEVLQRQQGEIAKKSNAKDAELQKILKENPENTQNTARIATLEKELADLDTQFEELAEQIKEPEQIWLDYLRRCLKQYDAVEQLISLTGIDVKSAAKIRLWLLHSTENPEKQTSFKLDGIVIDRKTGHARKKEGNIEVTGLRFVHEKTDYESDAPGELMIEYTDERGQKNTTHYRYFIHLINSLEGYGEIYSLEELQEQIKDALGFSEIMEGQEFSAQTITGLDENGKYIKENQTFKIKNIDARHQQITLDRDVLKTPRTWIPTSVHPGLYFDRRQQTFSFGEFAKLVRQHNYKRKIDISETDKVVSNAKRALQKDAKQWTDENGVGMPEISFTPPKDGETKDVIFLDDAGKKRYGKLTRTDEGFEFEDSTRETAGRDDLTEDLEKGVPLRFAAAKKAKNKWTKKHLDARSLMEAVNKGNIADANPAPADHGGHDAGHDMHASDAHGSDAHASHDDQKAKIGRKVSTEALPYSQIHKIGGMEGKKEPFLMKLWRESYFLSVDDFWELGKAMWEYYIRRFERRQKAKYSKLGEELPFFSPEMRRINQQVENEEVHQFSESFEAKGIWEIEKRLVETNNIDELKACISTLSEKGEMRWDNIHFWKKLNQFVTPDKVVPIPANGDPYTMQSAADERTGFDFLKGAIDSLWGEGSYDEWYSHNKSNFQSHTKNFYEEGKELENVPGGHQKRLQTLLEQHRRGEFVSPHEYEGLILHSIEAGKSIMQTKLYYMIEGVVAENPHGHTILSFDRIAHINSEMVTRFPLLEYITGNVLRPDGKRHRFTKDDYKKWTKEYFDKDDPMNCKPSQGVDEFLWKYILPSDDTQNRINKALRNGENLDHDDMFAYLPPATEEVVNDTCKATTGSKKFLTLEGYANAFPGFSQYLRSVSENNLRSKLREGIISFVRFEGIMNNRFKKGDDSYQRMKRATLNSPTIVTDTPPQAFIDELQAAIGKVITAYNDTELNDAWKLINTETGNIAERAEREKQDNINYAFERFSKIFTKVVKQDNGEKMTGIIAAANFEGMPFGQNEAEKAKRKAQYADLFSLD